MARFIRLLVLTALGLSPGAVAVWSQSTPDNAAAQAQLAALCGALKPRGGSCGSHARPAAPESSAMSSDPAAAGDAPGVRQPVVKPIDAWGHNVRISVDSGTVKLESPGANGELGDADDLVQRCPTE